MFYKGGLTMLRILKLFKNITVGNEQTGDMWFVRLHKTFGLKLCN